jgi:hypothetical protein
MSVEHMNVGRWDQVWIFLSLDLCNLFRSELLLPPEFGGEQQATVRTCLREKTLEHEPLEEGIVAMFKSVDASLSSMAENIFLWGEHIFVFEGPDRIAETVWHMASYWLQNHQLEMAEGWVYDFLAHVRTALNIQKSHYDEKVAQVRGQGLSGWDVEWAERTCGETDAVFGTIKLISTYNSFQIAWNELGADLPQKKLHHLFEVAVQIAQNNKFPHPVPYPNSWRLWTQRFLLK